MNQHPPVRRMHPLWADTTETAILRGPENRVRKDTRKVKAHHESESNYPDKEPCMKEAVNYG